MLPKAKGLCETSVPLLLPLGGPKENAGGAAGAAVTGEEPKVKGAFFSAPAGGVDGAAPNENGLAEDDLTSAVGAEPGRWSNENPPVAPEPKRGFGASTGVEAVTEG